MTTGRSGWREPTLVIAGMAALTVLLTAPLSFRLGTVARLDNADTRLLIWNVAWVARTLVVDPLHVFDANIFHPHRGTLAYSESNLGAGLLAVPVYWSTRNPFAAHNFVVVLSFVLSGACMYALVRHLTGEPRAAAIAAICFAFCPYVFSHLPHVHLLMTAGLPLSMLAFHRVADRPTPGRGAVLGLAVAGQAFFCGYYGIFAGLMVGFGVLIITATRRRWTDAAHWRAIAMAAGVTVAAALPLFLPYLRLQRATGFSRSVDEARLWAADWRSYLASSAHAHAWLLPLIGRWTEVLFPGFVAASFGCAGLVAAWTARGRLREVAIVYGGLGVLAFWASLGPDAGLYRLLYAVVPGFSFLHAPGRFGVIVAFALCVLAGVSVAALLERIRGRVTAAIVTAAVLAVAIFELRVPLSFSTVPPVEPAYRTLATLPRGPVIELPFYSRQFASARTQYMLSSTVHWMPLVNGYSSHVPQEFLDRTPVFGGFPSRESFALLASDRVRYAVFHLHLFSPQARDEVLARLREYEDYLALRYGDDRVLLYEILAYPAAR